MVHTVHGHSEFDYFAIDGVRLILNDRGDAFENSRVYINGLGFAESSKLASDASQRAGHCQQSIFLCIEINA